MAHAPAQITDCKAFLTEIGEVSKRLEMDPFPKAFFKDSFWDDVKPSFVAGLLVVKQHIGNLTPKLKALVLESVAMDYDTFVSEMDEQGEEPTNDQHVQTIMESAVNWMKPDNLKDLEQAASGKAKMPF